MVEINNQRKAFLDMLAWSEGTDNGRQKTRNHGYDVIVGGELFTDYSDHPRKLVTLNPKLKSTGAGRYQLLFRWWDAYRKAAWPERLLRKVRTLWHCNRLRSVALYPMIDRGLISRQAIDRCSNIWASPPGAGYGQFEHKADSLIAKFKRAERSERLMYEQSHRDYLALVICIIVCLSWAVNHYRDNAITYKAQRIKNARELKLANAAITDMQMRQRDVAALDAKYTEELADAKAENDALRDDVAAGRRRLHIKAVCQSVREATTASGVNKCSLPDWQTPLNRIISPSERG